MLEPLQVPAQLVLGKNLFVPSMNAIFAITGLGGGDNPEIELQRCGYDGTLVEPYLYQTFETMQANNYLVIVDQS